MGAGEEGVFLSWLRVLACCGDGELGNYGVVKGAGKVKVRVPEVRAEGAEGAEGVRGKVGGRRRREASGGAGEETRARKERMEPKGEEENGATAGLCKAVGDGCKGLVDCAGACFGSGEWGRGKGEAEEGRREWRQGGKSGHGDM